jgi:hypothetical protein
MDGQHGKRTDEGAENGYWQLPHEHLAAALSLDIPGEQLRVYLALADLTHGYGKSEDEISLSQIGKRAGGVLRSHVPRAIDGLRKAGLYADRTIGRRRVVRRIAWPPPPIGPGVAEAGSRGATKSGSRGATKGATKAGTYQDTKRSTKKEAERKGVVKWIDSEDRFEIPGRYMSKWSEAFPSVDIRAQVSQAESWYVSHPERRKKNHARFLNNWFARAQERPLSRSGKGSSGASRSNGGVPEYIVEMEQEAMTL